MEGDGDDEDPPSTQHTQSSTPNWNFAAQQQHVPSQSSPRREDFNASLVERAVVEALFEEGCSKPLNQVGGTPILTLCEFFEATTSTHFTTFKCAQHLRSRAQQTGRASIHATLSELEIITGAPIKLLHRRNKYRDRKSVV
jgi:hypothetical protein